MPPATTFSTLESHLWEAANRDNLDGIFSDAPGTKGLLEIMIHRE